MGWCSIHQSLGRRELTVLLYLRIKHRVGPEPDPDLTQTTSPSPKRRGPRQSQTFPRHGAWSELMFNSRSFKRSSHEKSARHLPPFPRALQFSHLAVSTPLIRNSSKDISNRLSISQIIAMASSLRMAAPKMASMAAQSTRQVARPQQFQKLARGFQTGKLRRAGGA